MKTTEEMEHECNRMPVTLGYLKMRDHAKAMEAKISERKTVHEWLNAKGTPREDHGKPLCLLRRIAIALGIHDVFRDDELIPDAKEPPSSGSERRPCSALRWTRNRPQSPGWYWLAAPIGYTPRIVRIWIAYAGRLSVQGEGGVMCRLDKRGAWKGCKWAGPILPPND